MLLATVGITVLLYSMWGDPWGGWAYGPRYLIPAMAIFSIGVAYWVSVPGKELLKRIVTFILVIPSSALALLGAITTNAIPPEVEGHQLNLPYTFIRNIEFLQNNRGGSFIYNTYFPRTPLISYYLVLLVVVIAVFFAVLFILPGRAAKKSKVRET